MPRESLNPAERHRIPPPPEYPAEQRMRRRKEQVPADQIETEEQEHEEQVTKIRKIIRKPRKQASEAAYPKELYADFSAEQSADGKIILPPELQQTVETSAEQFRSEAKVVTSITKGEPIATEYDSRTNNFSTQTRIMPLPDGRKVFAVYCHSGSVVHRMLDGFMKWANGLRMKKVSRKEWKTQFETKSNIPTIPNDDPNTVLLPFHENVNAYDVFAHNKEIKDFGKLTWASRVDAEEKLSLADSIITELKRVHDQGKAWGEAILPNIIFTKEKRPIICDPEIRYDEGMDPDEAKARDIKDIVISVCGALERTETETDFGSVVRRLLDNYKDSPVLQKLREIASRKRSFFQNIFFQYELVRSGAGSKKLYDTVLQHITAHLSPSEAE